MSRLAAGLALLALATVVGTHSAVRESARVNWANVAVGLAWLSSAPVGSPDDRLEDGIPDMWQPALWGRARAAIGVDPVVSYNGSHSARIWKANDDDAAVLLQNLTFLPPRREIHCGVLHRGAAAFMRIQAVGISGQDYAALSSTSDWALSEIRFVSPGSGDPVALMLGVGTPSGPAWFDDVYCRDASQPAGNLLRNAGFEEDGVRESPLQWWTSARGATDTSATELERAYQLLSTLSSRSPAAANRLNAIDLLLGRQERVAERMRRTPTGCLDQEYGHPTVLLGLGRKFQEAGGLAARERLLQLAMIVMAPCPQPYAALADLYRSVHAYERAAELYRAAAKRSHPGLQLGAYLFAEGTMHVLGTGDFGRAIEALSMAEQDAGWEATGWYQGAATMYLAEALTQVGRCEEARAAYRRVLDCRTCIQRHLEASTAPLALRHCPP